MSDTLANKDPDEYTVRDYTAIDRQVNEIANRESVLTNKLKQENLRKLAITSVIFAGALSAIIIASGIAIWLIKDQKIVEIVKEKIVEVIKEPKIIIEPHHHNHLQTKPSDNITNLNNKSRRIDSSDNNQLNNEINERLPNIQGSIGKKLNFSLIWNNFNDLDLHVKTPSGKIINFSQKQFSGGHLDSDKNIQNKIKVSNPIENIRWDSNPPKGKYQIYARFFSKDHRNKFQNTNYKIIVHKDQKIVESFQNNFDQNSVGKMVRLFDYEVN
jgi:hypothetical protein